MAGTIDRLITVMEKGFGDLIANQVKLIESIDRLAAAVQADGTKAGMAPTVTPGSAAFMGGIPDISHDEVVAWYGPDPAVVRGVMASVVDGRGASVITVEFPIHDSMPRPRPEVYREKSRDTGYQVHLVIGFPDPVNTWLAGAVDRWIRVVPHDDGRIEWSSFNSTGRDRGHGVIVAGPT